MDTLAPLNAVAYPEGAARSLNEGAVRHIVGNGLGRRSFGLSGFFITHEGNEHPCIKSAFGQPLG